MPTRCLATHLLLCLALVSAVGCASSYRTPGRGADMSLFGAQRSLDAGATGDSTYSTVQPQRQPQDPIERRLQRQPAAAFPVHLAVARVQAAGYRSSTNYGRGRGRYSVVTARDVETDADLERIAALPSLQAVAPVAGLLVPEDLHSDRDLREAAASLQCDMLLVYTFDTVFGVADTIEPLGVLTLGLFPSKEARVTSTVSALLLDTRTGYVYGAAEATAKRDQIANAWTSREAVDQSRLRAERQAFEQLIAQFETLWPGVVARHG